MHPVGPHFFLGIPCTKYMLHKKMSLDECMPELHHLLRHDLREMKCPKDSAHLPKHEQAYVDGILQLSCSKVLVLLQRELFSPLHCLGWPYNWDWLQSAWMITFGHPISSEYYKVITREDLSKFQPNNHCMQPPLVLERNISLNWKILWHSRTLRIYIQKRQL